MAQSESALFTVTPKSLSALTVIFLVLAVFFALLNGQKVKALRANAAQFQVLLHPAAFCIVRARFIHLVQPLLPSIEIRIANELAVRPAQVAATIALLDGGATVPFVARYRKEATGGLDDAQLRTLHERLGYLRELEDRRAAVLKSIEEQELRLTKREIEQRVMSVVGYKQITWAAYRSKYLDGVLIFLDDDDPVLLRVRGALDISAPRFAHIMTQTKTGRAASPSNEDDWRTAVRRLAMLGR